MQEKEGNDKPLKPADEDYDLLNTLDPKPEEKDEEDGLEELFPDNSSSQKKDEFMLNLLNTDEQKEKVEEDKQSIPFQESK